jgi:TetR/AcrR family transcriptional regulator
MDDIAGELELTKPALYRYFQNKEDLFLAVVLRGSQILEDLMEVAVSNEEKGLEKVLATGFAYWKFYQDYPDYCRLMMEARNRVPDFSDCINFQKLTKKDKNYISIMCEAIETGKHDGTIKEDIDSFMTAFYLAESTIAIIQSAEMMNDIFESMGKTKNDFILHSLDLMGHALKPINEEDKNESSTA